MRALLLALSLLPALLPAALLSPAQLQARLDGLRVPAFRRPGVVAAAVRRGQPTVYASAGMRELSERVPADPDTAFLWFSVTKLFTATAVLQLAEAGKIDLEAPLSKYLPEFQPGLKPGWRQPRVADLLSHSGGLPQTSPMEKFSAIHLAGEPRPSSADLVKQWEKPGAPLAYAPGTRFHYSNVGYLWLGLLVERVSHQSFEDYVQAKILKPLKMTHTGFSIGDPQKAARGYVRSGSLVGMLGALLGDERYDAGKVFGYRALRHFEVNGPSYAGLIGTVRDMARFATMLLQDGQLEGQRVLSPESCRKMRVNRLSTKGKAMGCGLGLWTRAVDGEAVAFHEGQGGGFRTELRLFPARGYAVVVASNDTEFDTGQIARLIVSAPVP